MKIKKSIKMTNEISMASTSDIAFLLIIFFMVTSAFAMKEGLHLVLPAKNKKPVIVKDKEITTLKIERNGTYLYNDEASDLVSIEQKLKELIAKNKDSIVLVKINNETVYQKVIDMIDVIKFVGVQKLSLKMIE